MVPPAFGCLFLVLILFSPIAAQQLSLVLDGPKSVSAVENFKVTTVVRNTGKKTLKLLKDPSGVLSNLATNTFNITDASGRSPSFIGVRSKFSPETAARLGDEDTFTTLFPGKAIATTHDLSEAYDFTSLEDGTYQIFASNHFYAVNLDNHVETIYADLQSHSARIRVSAGSKRPTSGARATFKGCNATQQAMVMEAAAVAKAYAAETLQYLLDTPQGSERFTTWFGNFSSSRHNTIVSHFDGLNQANIIGYSYDCTCTLTATWAYVYPKVVDYIYLCGMFWKVGTNGTDSRGGTLIHESTHWAKNGGTIDVVYGQAAARKLALSSPIEAIQNADSHEYLAENNPWLL